MPHNAMQTVGGSSGLQAADLRPTTRVSSRAERSEVEGSAVVPFAHREPNNAAILLQAFFNISVVLSLLPTKGIPLPFISSGGTSLFFTLSGIGILLNISKKVD